jgi:hypothetical protein
VLGNKATDSHSADLCMSSKELEQLAPVEDDLRIAADLLLNFPQRWLIVTEILKHKISW